MNIVIRIDVEEATEPVHALAKSTSELLKNGECTSTNCLRPLHSKTLCKACYRLSKRTAYTPSEDALRRIASWVEVVKSKPSKQQQRSWAKTFDEMVRIYKLTWDEIATINSHALAIRCTIYVTHALR